MFLKVFDVFLKWLSDLPLLVAVEQWDVWRLNFVIPSFVSYAVSACMHQILWIVIILTTLFYHTRQKQTCNSKFPLASWLPSACAPFALALPCLALAWDCRPRHLSPAEQVSGPWSRIWRGPVQVSSSRFENFVKSKSPCFCFDAAGWTGCCCCCCCWTELGESTLALLCTLLLFLHQSLLGGVAKVRGDTKCGQKAGQGEDKERETDGKGRAAEREGGAIWNMDGDWNWGNKLNYTCYSATYTSPLIWILCYELWVISHMKAFGSFNLLSLNKVDIL